MDLAIYDAIMANTHTHTQSKPKKICNLEKRRSLCMPFRMAQIVKAIKINEMLHPMTMALTNQI